MLKRGISCVSLILFSILLIVTFSNFVNAVCGPAGAQLRCDYISDQWTCDNDYGTYCYWEAGSCYPKAIWCSDIDTTHSYLCTSAVGCTWTASCTPNDHISCYNGDAYWFDSCGNLGSLYDDCTGSETCSGGICITTCGENGASCSTGTDCCSGYCPAGTCAASCVDTPCTAWYGTCPVSGMQYCSNGVLGSCVASVSHPCIANGWNCGNDGCGGTCGSCTAPQTCGGGGTANVCGCTPTTCVALGATCGNPSNGCGGTLSCGTCSLANAVSACSSGNCVISSCNGGFGNCDGNPLNGCENTLDSLANCGSCGTTCSRANAIASCSGDSCHISSCNAGWLNCDFADGNGCEKSTAVTQGTLTSCGTVTCNSGYGNCDGDPLNGCETNTNTNVNNCGVCRFICDIPNANEACSAGSCIISSCSAGWLNCDGYTDTGCEQSTAVTQGTLTACGSVTCNSGYLNCDGNALNGCEVNKNTDVNNCGVCGNVCSAANTNEACSAGSCIISSCSAGFGNCDGNALNGCENTLDSLANCGSCGTACSRANAAASCSGDSCHISICNPGFGNCDGNDLNGCENTLNSLTNCVDCGTPCSRANAAATCASGSCVISSCNGGYLNCDGTDLNGCERSTAVTQGTLTSCNTVTCNAGYLNCDGNALNGCEVNKNTDVNNCGVCGTVCSVANANEACSAGSCTISSCSAGYLNCDGNYANGCEQSTSVTQGTLTSCGTVTCNSGYGNCDGNALNGCETNTNTNVNNCGSCGTICNLANANEGCSGGSCTISSCSAG